MEAQRSACSNPLSLAAHAAFRTPLLQPPQPSTRTQRPRPSREPPSAGARHVGVGRISARRFERGRAARWPPVACARSWRASATLYKCESGRGGRGPPTGCLWATQRLSPPRRACAHVLSVVVDEDGEVEVGGRRVAQLGVLEVAELHGKLDVHVLLARVLLREGDGLDGDKHGDGALGGERDVATVADAPSDGARQLEAVSPVFGGEVVLGRLAVDRDGLAQHERDVRTGAHVLLKDRLDDDVNGRRLLEQVLPSDRNALDRLVDCARTSSKHAGHQTRAGLAHDVADRARKLIRDGTFAHLERCALHLF
mmetsp:Transcript_15640/g.33458  ORF Transcript_15640/g.33458 Transcript_15640/m.33458 type:complete len:311 (+) Transcript_15640:141-1073(+)